MRVTRHKKFQRSLAFYKQQFGFQPPYQILVDGTFANSALATKVNMKEQFPKYFDGVCKLLVTPCTLLETEQLGPTLYGAVQVLKCLQLFKCSHAGAPVPASSCLKSIARKVKSSGEGGGDGGDPRFIVATQDTNLRAKFREVIGVPLIYLHGNAPNLEKPSEKTVKWTEKRDRKKLEVSSYQKEILQHIREDLLPTDGGPGRKGTRKRKRAGPNPLSCKKAKRGSGAHEGQASQAPSSSKVVEVEEPKKRKRIRVKVPKHVKELKKS